MMMILTKYSKLNRKSQRKQQKQIMVSETTNRKTFIICLISLSLTFLVLAVLSLRDSNVVYNGDDTVATLSTTRRLHKDDDGNDNEDDVTVPAPEQPPWLKVLVDTKLKTAGNGIIRVGLVSSEAEDGEMLRGPHVASVHVRFDSAGAKWEELFPEWIDEGAKWAPPKCPEIPLPSESEAEYDGLDVVVARVPCGRNGTRRDVAALQLNLAAASLAVRGNGDVHVAFVGQCGPMGEIFRCEDLLMKREGEVWVYKPRIWRLQEKLLTPVGSCQLARPIPPRSHAGFLFFYPYLNQTYKFRLTSSSIRNQTKPYKKNVPERRREKKQRVVGPGKIRVRDDPSLVGVVRVRRGGPGAQPAADKHDTRAGSAGGLVLHRPQIGVGPALRRLEDPPNPTHPQPLRCPRLVQRVELQQAPHIPAHRLPQGGLHRLGPRRSAKPGPPHVVPCALRRPQRQVPLQLRPHAPRALPLPLRGHDAQELPRRLLQRRRPGLPQRDLRLVAPPSRLHQPPQSLRLRRPYPPPGWRGGRALPRPQALDVLQGLRLQLGHGRPPRLRQRLCAPEMVGGLRLHAREPTKALRAHQKDGLEDPEVAEHRHEEQPHRRTLEDCSQGSKETPFCRLIYFFLFCSRSTRPCVLFIY